MLLKVENLNTYYEKLHAIWDINFEVDQGEIVTLVGNNGAGKSTLLKSVAGVIKSRTGSILYNGKEVRGIDSHKLVREGIVLCPEGRQIFPRMSVWENLRMGAFTRHDKGEIEASFERVFQLFQIGRAHV